MRLYLGDCLEVLKDLPAGSVDAVVTDPPYGCGITVHDLESSNWDALPDLGTWWQEVARICGGFVAVFGAMPTLSDWHGAASAAGFKFCEHVVWVKRNATPAHRLSRTHESILVYRHPGAPAQFYKLTGPYEDVKVPGIMFDVISIEAFKRAYSDMRQAADGKSTQRARGGIQRHGKFSAGWKMERAYRDVNFTNVWSFLPPTQSRNNGIREHPTQKPVDVMARLAEMLTPEGATVLDPFMGSGTTGVACVQTGRNFIGIEISEQYFKIAERRIAEAQQQMRLPMEATV